MQEYHQVTSDTVQDLYEEIEHLIDVPFDQFQKDVHQYQSISDHANDFSNPEQCQQREATDNSTENEQVVPSTKETREAVTHDKDYTFDRPILIESDSDEIEEELAAPEEQYTILTCYKCNKQIPFESHSTNTLSVSNQTVATNICSDCSTKKRTRSRSFTLDGSNVFSQLADKLKHSFGSSSGSQLLSPGKSVDRRKSMPSMNAAFLASPQQLEPPSPVSSRPSSRASSFIEDVKQFLSPLSRKSSRNSMYQEYQQSPEGPKRKTSHNSLFDAMNICKPRSRYSSSPCSNTGVVYPEDDGWAQEDDEVMYIHQRQKKQQEDDEYPLLDVEGHNMYIPLRRKQIKQIESRQERINVYNNAYLECMNTQTDLVPWIIKQTQKGPPDAWFGYAPPPREPKKIMGIFKRKSKGTQGGNNLRAQQQQLGDELLNRSTPLLQHRFSNSNLSVSPGGNSFLYSDQEYTNSPSAINDHRSGEQQDEYFYSYQDQQDNGYEYQQQPTQHISHEKNQNTMSSNTVTEEPVTSTASAKSQTVKPVSILKKSNSSKRLEIDSTYDQYHDEEAVPYDDLANDDDDFGSGPDYMMDRQYSTIHYPEQPRRPMSTMLMDDYHHGNMMMPTKDRRRYSGHSPGYHYGMMHEPDHYYASMPPIEPPMPRNRRRSRPRSTESFNPDEDYYYRASTPVSRARSPYEDPYYHHQPPPPMSSRSRRRSSSRYRYDMEDDIFDRENDEETEEHYHSRASRRMPPPPIKTKVSNNKSPQEYYGLGVKLTPYVMEEWEMTLDDLCDLFPRLDRHYINDFLRSAKGDFVIAKEMIMEMIMEIR